MRRQIKKLALSLLLALLGASAPAQSDRVSIRVDAARSIGTMAPIWAFFGYDEPNYTYLPDGKKLLSELAALSPVPVYIRTHNLLTSGDGTPALKWGSTNAYTEDAAGRPRAALVTFFTMPGPPTDRLRCKESRMLTPPRGGVNAPWGGASAPRA